MNNLKNIINEAIKNGGATLDHELKTANLKNGFMVSKNGYEITTDPKNIEFIEKTILKYQKIIKKHEFIGLWLDNNILYIDISKNYIDKMQAIKTGIFEKQKAIYDLKNNINIYLTKNTYILYKYIKNINDYIYIKEYNNINELKKDFKSQKNIYQFIYNNIDKIKNLHLLKDQYIIIKDQILINE